MSIQLLVWLLGLTHISAAALENDGLTGGTVSTPSAAFPPAITCSIDETLFFMDEKLSLVYSICSCMKSSIMTTNY